MAALQQQFMARAIRLAEKGKYSVHGNPCVGCVLVRQGEIVGEGYHRIAGQGHAEANALADAGDKAKDSIAYVTLEPCSFTGRTPSCAQALIDVGVSHVVVAMLDPDIRNAGKGVQKIRDAGIEVTTPYMPDSAANLVKGHCLRLTEARPFVRLKLAMTLDGKTALKNGESKWITSPEARADVQRLRAMSSAIVTGVQTVIDDDPRLSVRAEELNIEDPESAVHVTRPVYILDSGGRVPADALLLTQPATVLVTTQAVSDRAGVEVLTMPAKDERVDLGALLSELAARGHNQVLFECGATLAGALVQERLVDEIIIFVSAKFIGRGGRSLLNLPEIDRMTDLAELTISDIRKVGADFRITASVL
jgi:diaminohydroxyphosphoribosylaminopyrimidine deaminase/5-amino-6-(5-phosphoribosylamino)uracil reductase